VGFDGLEEPNSIDAAPMPAEEHMPFDTKSGRQAIELVGKQNEYASSVCLGKEQDLEDVLDGE